jgi:hypothetical protein
MRRGEFTGLLRSGRATLFAGFITLWQGPTSRVRASSATGCTLDNKNRAWVSHVHVQGDFLTSCDCVGYRKELGQ